MAFRPAEFGIFAQGTHVTFDHARAAANAEADVAQIAHYFAPSLDALNELAGPEEG